MQGFYNVTKIEVMLLIILSLTSFLSVFSFVHVLADTAVVGDMAYYGVAYNFQRKGFYHNGLWWVFYANDATTHMGYKTSSDLSTWSSFTEIRTAGSGGHFDIWFNNTHVFYVYCSLGTVGQSVYFRMGIPKADGTISWSAGEQTVSGPSTFQTVSICTDTNGYPWITYGFSDALGFNITKNSKTDGTWVDDAGFPLKVHSIYSYAKVVPLTAGKVAMVYHYGWKLRSRCWNGTALTTEKAISTDTVGVDSFSVVAQGDNLHIVFLRDITNKIVYYNYTYATDSLSKEQVLSGGSYSSDSYPTICYDVTNARFFCVWTKTSTDNVYYTTASSTGKWDANETLWFTDTDISGFTGDQCSLFYSDYGQGMIAFLYPTASGYELNVYFYPRERALDIDPEILNLRSKGKWITGYIELPEGYDVADINVSTILLNDTFPAESTPTAIGDYDNDGVSDLTVKFNRTAVSEFIFSEGIKYGIATLTITGKLNNGTVFGGSDIIRVRMPGDINCDGIVGVRDVVSAASALGSHAGQARWNPNADENEDGIINAKDLCMVARDFNKSYR